LQSHAKNGGANLGTANLPHIAQVLRSVMNNAAFS